MYECFRAVNEADEGLRKLLCVLAFVPLTCVVCEVIVVQHDLIEGKMGSGNPLAFLQTLVHARLTFNK